MQIGLRFGTGSVLVKFQQVYYVLDPELRLIWVGGEWDEFALSNSGSNAIANAVLSTSLLGHISDEPTRRATVQMIEAVQEVQAPLRIDYRCDSPSMLRRFLMTIQPMRDNRVLIVHDLRDARRVAVAAQQDVGVGVPKLALHPVDEVARARAAPRHGGRQGEDLWTLEH